MSDIQNNPAEQQAIWWQARLSSDLLTEQQRQAFEGWLAERPENALAWRGVNEFWTGLDGLLQAESVSEPSAQVLALKKVKPTKPLRNYLKWGLSLAASLLLCFKLIDQPIGYYLADYRSGIGLQQQIALADGSMVLLDSGSAISVDFSDSQRSIRLHQGEAYFKVAADSKRPFVVQADAGQVQALGTAFDVRKRDGDVSVTVFEHAVKVSHSNGEIQERLAESEQLSFDKNHLKQPVHVNVQFVAAWQHKRMIFQDKALEEVVAELNRYRPGKIIILNEAIKKLPITGVFDIGDTNIALQSIEQSLPVKINKFTERLVFLSAS